VALADELRSKEKVDFLFIGPEKGVDTEILSNTEYPLRTLNVQGLPRKASAELLKSVLRLAKSIPKATKILKEFKPDIVVGMGGYGSFPVVTAARLLRIPTLIHEQNAVPGMANKLLGKVVDAIAVSFPETEAFFPKTRKKVLTGNPLRKELNKLARDEARAFFQLDSNRRTLLIFGGSLGAKRLNNAVIQAYPLFRTFDNLQILHLTGRDNYQGVLSEVNRLKDSQDKVSYQAYPYLEEMGLAYAAADLAVARAGATSVAEITALGVPAILVPYPYAAEGHQEKNARFLEKRGAARVILDHNLTGQSLFSAVEELLFTTKSLMEMRSKTVALGKPEAAHELAKMVRNLVHQS